MFINAHGTSHANVYSPTSPLTIEDLNTHSGDSTSNTDQAWLFHRPQVVLALPYTPSFFCGKRRRDAPLFRSQSLSSFLGADVAEYNVRKKKKTRQLEEWDARGGFNLWPLNNTTTRMSKCITDISMARHMGVELGSEITSRLPKKRPAIISIADPNESWSLKRNKVEGAPPTATRTDQQVANTTSAAPSNVGFVVSPKEPPNQI